VFSLGKMAELLRIPELQAAEGVESQKDAYFRVLGNYEAVRTAFLQFDEAHQDPSNLDQEVHPQLQADLGAVVNLTSPLGVLVGEDTVKPEEADILFNALFKLLGVLGNTAGADIYARPSEAVMTAVGSQPETGTVTGTVHRVLEWAQELADSFPGLPHHEPEQIGDLRKYSWHPLAPPELADLEGVTFSSVFDVSDYQQDAFPFPHRLQVFLNVPGVEPSTHLHITCGTEPLDELSHRYDLHFQNGVFVRGVYRTNFRGSLVEATESVHFETPEVFLRDFANRYFVASERLQAYLKHDTLRHDAFEALEALTAINERYHSETKPGPRLLADLSGKLQEAQEALG
jgi:hypothetical protein